MWIWFLQAVCTCEISTSLPGAFFLKLLNTFFLSHHCKMEPMASLVRKDNALAKEMIWKGKTVICLHYFNNLSVLYNDVLRMGWVQYHSVFLSFSLFLSCLFFYFPSSQTQTLACEQWVRQVRLWFCCLVHLQACLMAPPRLPPRSARKPSPWSTHRPLPSPIRKGVCDSRGTSRGRLSTSFLTMLSCRSSPICPQTSCVGAPVFAAAGTTWRGTRAYGGLFVWQETCFTWTVRFGFSLADCARTPPMCVSHWRRCWSAAVGGWPIEDCTRWHSAAQNCVT